MKELVVTIYKSDLIKSVGKAYREVLRSLLRERLINGFKDAVEVRMDKDKALHFQSALAFHSAKDVPIGPIKHYKKED